MLSILDQQFADSTPARKLDSNSYLTLSAIKIALTYTSPT
tara:strand:- start:51 stop:170 length:120 start_codon:yes stop_codon:yes gene_type:complete